MTALQDTIRRWHENACWQTSVQFNPHFTDQERRRELRKVGKERRELLALKQALKQALKEGERA